MNPLIEQLREEATQLVGRVRANQNYQELEQRYNGLSDRDRVAVNVLVLVVALFLVYQLVLSPAMGYLTKAGQSYQRELENREWMVKHEPEVRQRLTVESSVREGSLLSIASATAKNYELSFSRFEPIGDDRVRLWLEQVQFNNIVSWLGEMQTQNGISAVDISIDSGSPGYVSVRLTLQG